MKYFSTRNKSLEFSFKDIFLRGLAPDGGQDDEESELTQPESEEDEDSSTHPRNGDSFWI